MNALKVLISYFPFVLF